MSDGREVMQGLTHLVDDDDLLRAYAAETLGAVGRRTQGHGSGVAFLEALPGLEPGAILLDIEMPGLSGLDVLDALSARKLGWPVVVLTARSDLRTAVEAMKRGALEFLQKPFTADELFGVLDDALGRLAVVSEDAARGARARQLIDGLSGRELQVLRGMLAGLQNKQIAYELDLSVRTVEIYRGKVMDKLEVRSLSAAVRLAMAADVEPLAESAGN
jgi:two-component system response regulator FixJ